MPLPLGTVYVLAGREEHAAAPRIERLEGADAVAELISAGYPQIVYDRRTQAEDLDCAARVGSVARVARVTAPNDPRRLEDLAAAIDEDFSAVHG